MSIFISIASYRDPETIPTILDCYNKSKNKNDLRFGVLLQDSPGYTDKSHLSSSIKADFLEYDWHDSKGTCWARHTIQKLLYNNEDYYLQLDSHHRFCENWDSILIDMIDKLKQNYEKPIIGGYCPGYKPDIDQNLEHKPMKITTFPDFTQTGDLMFIPRAIKNQIIKDNPNFIKAKFLSGHFIFSDGIFVTECPYDPHLYFRGEELTLSARAYTSGYDLFHPTIPLVWHEYLRPAQSKHWNDHTKDNGFIITADERSEAAKTRARHLLGIENSNTQFGKYGLGKIRSIHEYELYSGLSFVKKTIHKFTYDINDDSPEPYIMSETEWKDGMLKKYTVEIEPPNNCIKSMIDNGASSIALIFYDAKNRVSYRKDIKKTEYNYYIGRSIKINSSMESTPIKVKILPFSSTRIPAIETKILKVSHE